jgi:hypothetical protein
LLKEIKDILDETKMIRAILADQFTVLNDSSLAKEATEAQLLLKGIDRTFELMEIRAKSVETGASISNHDISIS